jgi:hypothetical protein
MKYILILLISYNSLFAINELLTKLEQRAIEQVFYEKINKINKIQFAINQYIMNHGTKPTRINLISENVLITDDWWPKQYKSTSVNIDFNIDANDFL